MVGGGHHSLPNATGSERSTGTCVVLALEVLGRGSWQGHLELISKGIASLSRSLNAREINSDANGSGNACFDVFSNTSIVLYFLFGRPWEGSRAIAFTIDPRTLRSRPRTGTRCNHCKLLLRVSIALVELRISVTWELEAFLGGFVLPHIDISNTRVVQNPLLVRCTSARLSSWETITGFLLRLKTPVGLSTNDGAVLIGGPLLSRTWILAFLIVDKKRSIFRHVSS